MCDFYNDFFFSFKFNYVSFITLKKGKNELKQMHFSYRQFENHCAVGIEWSCYEKRERETERKKKLNELNPNTSEDRQVPEKIEKKIQTKEKKNNP